MPTIFNAFQLDSYQVITLIIKWNYKFSRETHDEDEYGRMKHEFVDGGRRVEFYAIAALFQSFVALIKMIWNQNGFANRVNSSATFSRRFY